MYAAAKGALSTFTRGLARELAPEGFRVNAVSPGVIETRIHDRHTPPEIMERFKMQIPLGRVGQPQDCVGAFLFLASERLASFVTGQVLEVNGGHLMI
jgi:3-oxoacyl-[acyl-carrier protein] reductase